MKPADPMQVEYTMNITLTLADWQELRGALGSEQKFPQSLVRERIEDAVRQTMREMRGRDTDGNLDDEPEKQEGGK